MNKEQLLYFDSCTKHYKNRETVEYIKNVINYQLSNGVAFERVCWFFDGSTILPKATEISNRVPLMTNDWLDTRVINALKRDGVVTLGQLTALTRRDVLLIPGIGRQGLSNILGYLDDLGLTI